MKNNWRKIVSLFLGVILSITMISNISAQTAISPEQIVVNELVEILNDYGITVTSSDIAGIQIEICGVVDELTANGELTREKACEIILMEIMSETAAAKNQAEAKETYSVTSDTSGGATLPVSQKADIFFTDNSWPWNHVGLYASATTIIESMPTPGVQLVSIYDENAKQDCVDSSHNQSAIYRLTSMSLSDIDSAVNWARGYIGYEYNEVFVNNKNNTESSNSKFNCSELVWKSYHYGTTAAYDLDSDGGLSVYPNDIIESSLLTYIQAFGN